MFEKHRVLRITLPMVMRPRIRYSEIDELQTLTVLGPFHFALRTFDRASDELDMRIETEDVDGSERARKRGEEGEGGFHEDLEQLSLATGLVSDFAASVFREDSRGRKAIFVAEVTV